MIPSLAPCFTGIFIHYKDALALPGEHKSFIQGRDLLDPIVMESLLSRFAEARAGGDRRAIVSMWTQWHFGALIIPTAAAILFLEHDLPVELDHVGIAVDDSGKTAAIILPDLAASEHACAGERFSRLFQGHVEPLIRKLAGQFKVSPRLLWNNASDIFEWTLLQANSIGTARSDALNEGHALLKSKIGSNGRPNPMFDLVRYLPQGDQTIRQRKLCCLRYLLPGVECCGSLCPTPPPKVPKAEEKGHTDQGSETAAH
jgi:ferric iron reductase protein FhuF